MRLIGLAGDGHELVAQLVIECQRAVLLAFSDRLRERDAAHLIQRAESVRRAAIAGGASLMLVTGMRLADEFAWIERHGGQLVVVHRGEFAIAAPIGRLRPVHLIRVDRTVDELRRVVIDLVGELTEEPR